MVIASGVQKRKPNFEFESKKFSSLYMSRRGKEPAAGAVNK